MKKLLVLLLCGMLSISSVGVDVHAAEATEAVKKEETNKEKTEKTEETKAEKTAETAAPEEQKKEEIRKKPYSIEPVSYPQSILFETVHLLNNTVIKLNVNHPFYKQVLQPLCGGFENANADAVENQHKQDIKNAILHIFKVKNLYTGLRFPSTQIPISLPFYLYKGSFRALF